MLYFGWFLYCWLGNILVGCSHSFSTWGLAKNFKVKAISTSSPTVVNVMRIPGKEEKKISALIPPPSPPLHTHLVDLKASCALPKKLLMLEDFMLVVCTMTFPEGVAVVVVSILWVWLPSCGELGVTGKLRETSSFGVEFVVTGLVTTSGSSLQMTSDVVVPFTLIPADLHLEYKQEGPCSYYRKQNCGKSQCWFLK